MDSRAKICPFFIGAIQAAKAAAVKTPCVNTQLLSVLNLFLFQNLAHSVS